MLDINYYMTGERSPYPALYNIETTNKCNQTCSFCPRTKYMTRPVETLEMWVFERIVQQIRPWSKDEWDMWVKYCESHYKVFDGEQNENHFLLYIIAKSIVLHGYGEPLLDPHIADRVAILKDEDIPVYFSSNYNNVSPEKVEPLFDVGLDYLKIAVSSTEVSRIEPVIALRDKYNYPTTIVLATIFPKVWEVLKKFDSVYKYLKSQDQQWVDGKTDKAKSIHWSEPCKFPWSTMSIQSNGLVSVCMEDYDNELIMGDAKTESLYDIWNSEDYEFLRTNQHRIDKCMERCDIRVM